MNHQASISRSTARYSLNDLGGGASGLSFARMTNRTKATPSGISASPKTLFQPYQAASVGANSAANTVPEFPAPAMPSAVPWCSGGYQRDAKGKATAKDAPATPRNAPSSMTCEKAESPISHAMQSAAMTVIWPM